MHSRRSFLVSGSPPSMATIQATLSHTSSFPSFLSRHRPIRQQWMIGIPPMPTQACSLWDERRISSASEVCQKAIDDSGVESGMIKDLIDRSRELIRSDGGPPRWFSPLECASPLRDDDAPLLLYLPGIDGVGLGLIRHHQRLGKIFDVWCLHIPVMDRTPFKGIVDFIEKTVKSENSHLPGKPIYLVGESFGGCLALAVAACNPDIDLVLILGNPATWFSRSRFQPFFSFLNHAPELMPLNDPWFLYSNTGDCLRMVMTNAKEAQPLQQAIEGLLDHLEIMLFSFSLLVDVLPKESLLWKLKMLSSGSAFANSHLHAVKAETLILSSGSDIIIPSLGEAERLQSSLPDCRVRHFKDHGQTLFLEGDIDLATILKGTGFYHRSKQIDYITDYLLPTSSEIGKLRERKRWIDVAFSPVMLSSLDNRKIIRGLEGIPSEGPVLFVGYHSLYGIELVPLVAELLIKKSISVRGIAHPLLFEKTSEQKLKLTLLCDIVRLLGAVPVSANNIYRLLSRKSFVLLYPGGVREALHRKGEQYKLFWPAKTEFVRMAARFGATIIPFGVVGEDDIFEMLLDYDDLVAFPFFKSQIEELNKNIKRLREDAHGEVINQDFHYPTVLAKFPGRLYFLFGQPIVTRGREEELRDRKKAREMYMHVKSEVENCISYLKEKREKDPYRSLLSRILYQAANGTTSEIPTFEL